MTGGQHHETARNAKWLRIPPGGSTLLPDARRTDRSHTTHSMVAHATRLREKTGMEPIAPPKHEVRR